MKLLPNKEKLYVIILISFCLWRLFSVFYEIDYYNIFTNYYISNIATLPCTSEKRDLTVKKSVDFKGPTITATGDSLTHGSWLLGEEETYPFLLQSHLGNSYQVINDGISSETSLQSATRLDSKITHVKISNYKNVLFKITSTQGRNPSKTRSCYILKWMIRESYGILTPNNVFIPYKKIQETTKASSTSFVVNTPDLDKNIFIIWVGTNDTPDYKTTLENIAHITSSIHNEKFLVLPIINRTPEARGTPAYNKIHEINHKIAETYKNKYLDVRLILVNSYDKNLPQDVTDNLNDVPPRSLRLDNIHLNKKGNELVAKAVKNKLLEMHWVGVPDR